MNLLAVALVLAATTGSAPQAEVPRGGSGAQVASTQVRAAIVEAVAVRQASGLQLDDNAPVPQLNRHGRTILVEFE